NAVPGVGRAEPALGVRPDEAARRGRRGQERVDRAELGALRLDGSQLRADDARAGGGARRGSGRGRPALGADLRRAPGGGAAGGRGASSGDLARGGGGRVHLGRARGGDLRGGGSALSRAARVHGGAGATGAASRVLGAAKRAGRRATSSTLAR